MPTGEPGSGLVMHTWPKSFETVPVIGHIQNRAIQKKISVNLKNLWVSKRIHVPGLGLGLGLAYPVAQPISLHLSLATCFLSIQFLYICIGFGVQRSQCPFLTWAVTVGLQAYY